MGSTSEIDCSVLFLPLSQVSALDTTLASYLQRLLGFSLYFLFFIVTIHTKNHTSPLIIKNQYLKTWPFPFNGYIFFIVCRHLKMW